MVKYSHTQLLPILALAVSAFIGAEAFAAKVDVGATCVLERSLKLTKRPGKGRRTKIRKGTSVTILRTKRAWAYVVGARARKRKKGYVKQARLAAVCPFDVTAAEDSSTDDGAAERSPIVASATKRSPVVASATKRSPIVAAELIEESSSRPVEFAALSVTDATTATDASSRLPPSVAAAEQFAGDSYGGLGSALVVQEAVVYNAADAGSDSSTRWALDIGVVSTYYRRGVIVSGEPHNPTLLPTLRIDFPFGISLGAAGAFTLMNRSEDAIRAADQTNVTLSYAGSVSFLDFEVGGIGYLFANKRPVAYEGDLYATLGIDLPGVTPSWTNYLTVNDQIEAAWYSEFALNSEIEIGPGTLGLSAAFGLESDGVTVTPSDLRGTLSYKYTSSRGAYVAPSISFGHTLNPNKRTAATATIDGLPLGSVFWGGMNVGF